MQVSSGEFASDVLDRQIENLRQLSIKLHIARHIIAAFPNGYFDRFPPTDKDLNQFDIDEIISFDVQGLLAEVEGKKSDRIITRLSVIESINNLRENIPINDPRYFTDLAIFAFVLVKILEEIQSLFKVKHFEGVEMYVLSGYLSFLSISISNLFLKSGEMLGYWTSKMEIKKQGKKNVSVRTEKKRINIDRLKSMVREGGGEVTRKLIISAMGEFDVTEKTIQNYLKEINTT